MYKSFKDILIILLGSIVASEEVGVFVYVFCHFLIKLFSVYCVYAVAIWPVTGQGLQNTK